MVMERQFVTESRFVGKALKIVAGASMLLLAAGLAIYLQQNQPAAENTGPAYMSLSQALAGSLRLEPLALMTLGTVLLLMTPFVRVLGAFFTFLVKKDITYAAVSLGVLIILVAGLFIPALK